MAENLLSDARVRSASFDRDGAYLPDGGGLRIRLLPPSRNHARGARLAEFHFKLKAADGYKNGALHLGTIGEPFEAGAGQVRPFTLADARRKRDAARELVSRGIDPREAQRLENAERAETQRRRLQELDSRRTVRQAFEHWRDTRLSAARKDGGRAIEALFELHVLPAIGDRPLAEVRRAEVAALLDVLAARGKVRTAHLALAQLRALFRWCAQRDEGVADPTLTLKSTDFGGRLRARERALSALEIVELRDAIPKAKLPERITRAIWVLLATGARVGELSAARIADFDLDACEWCIPTSKTGRPHVVALSDFALGHIRRLVELAGRSAFLLPRRIPRNPDTPREDRPIGHEVIGKATKDRQRATPLPGRSPAAEALRLALGPWTPHDLRRTMATRMREDLRVSSDVIERCLNHAPQGIVAVYQRVDLLPERRAAFELWGNELERLMTARRENVVDFAASRRGRAA